MAEYRTKNIPEVTRRLVLATSAAISAMMDGLLRADEHASDPIQLLWREWQTFHNEAVVKCYRAQDLEAQLLRTVGAPMIRIRRGPDAEDLMAHSHDDIDHIVAESNTPDTVAEDLHRKLATHQREWNDESDRIGFAAAVQQEDQAWARERETAGMIFRAPAKSLTGVQIKLALIMQMSVDGTGDVMFPLSHLQSILNDLTSLIKA